MRNARMMLAAGALGMALLGGCEVGNDVAEAPTVAGTDPVLANAWVRLPAAPGAPAAAYFTIKAGIGNTRVVGAHSADAGQVTLHETGRDSGMAVMRPLAALDLLANQTAVFAPGGRHAMMMGLRPGIAPGSTVDLRIDFADRTFADTKALAVGPSDPPPGVK